MTNHLFVSFDHEATNAKLTCFFHLPKMVTFWHPNVKLKTFPAQNFQQFTKLSKTFNEEICLLKLNKSETEISSVDKILGKIS